MGLITIKPNSGSKIRVTTSGSLWGFRAGDKITSNDPGSRWHKKRVVVKGFNFKEEALWGQAGEDSFCLKSILPDGLVHLK